MLYFHQLQINYLIFRDRNRIDIKKSKKFCNRTYESEKEPVVQIIVLYINLVTSKLGKQKK